VRIVQTQLVRARRQQVFEAWTDCESWPRWDPIVFTEVTVTERAGNTVRLDAQVKVMGLRTRRTEKHVLTPPEKVEVEGEIRGMTNTTVWTFEEAPDGTMVTAVADAQLKGLLRLLGPLVRWQGQTVLRQWMRAFAKYVEAEM
jgi:ribosome-associated toxin RatA of RatAB toxin-antitoxin module